MKPVAFAVAVASLPLTSAAQTPSPTPTPSPSASPYVQTRTLSLSFKGPAGWTRLTTPGAGTAFYVRDGDKLHTLSFNGVPPNTASDVESYAAQRIDAERKRGAEIVDDGATTICSGEPAHRWTVRSASTGVAMETHVLAATVTGGVATATYSHKQGVGDRRDGLDAMENLCPGPLPNPVPAGWTSPKSRVPGLTQTLESPDSTSTFVATYRVMSSDRFDAFEKDALSGGTIVNDRHEACGTANVHRIDLRVGGQIAELSLAFLHGTAYKYVYTRPAAHEADGAAERALTAFCRAAELSAPAAAPA